MIENPYEYGSAAYWKAECEFWKASSEEWSDSRDFWYSRYQQAKKEITRLNKELDAHSALTSK